MSTSKLLITIFYYFLLLITIFYYFLLLLLLVVPENIQFSLITDKIYELVNSGIQDVNQIKDNLHCFVEGEFSLGASKDELSAILDQNNRAYYPTNHDIRNHMVGEILQSFYFQFQFLFTVIIDLF